MVVVVATTVGGCFGLETLSFESIDVNLNFISISPMGDQTHTESASEYLYSECKDEKEQQQQQLNCERVKLNQ